jgi:hypothetical protein
MRLKVRLVGVPPCVVPNRVSPWAMALTVGQAEGEAAEGRVRFERRTDLLEESIEGSVARRRIAFREVNLSTACW